MFDLHRHTEFSSFDGFGSAEHLAAVAKENGLTALGISDHGNINGLVAHYFACKKEDIKPILGCEVYYQPIFDEDAKSYHLCLFAKNLQGYKNLCKIITIANKENFYRTAKVTDKLLEKYHEGLICSSACIASIFSQRIIEGKKKSAYDLLMKFRDLFGSDFYIEIQPYKIDKENTQEDANVVLMKLAKKLGIDCVLTSDSHYGKKEEFDTIVKMHQIAKHTGIDIEQTYKERYMPAAGELEKRFKQLYTQSEVFTAEEVKWWLKRFTEASKRLEDSVDGNILDCYDRTEIVYDRSVDGYKLLCSLIKKGMKKYGKTSAEYVKRVKEELEVIKENGFVDYFLIVQDYVAYAKKNGIKVGPGRGSVCNCVIAYFLGITEVDSVFFGLDYTTYCRRF